MNRFSTAALLLLPALAGCASSASSTPSAPTLSDVRSFMYQIQGISRDGAVAALAATHYDMLVVEPQATVKGDEGFDLAGMVATLKASGAKSFEHKLVLAYVDIGEAEDYRTYWESGWVAPAGSDCDAPGTPDFIVRTDPDGWEGNYPVAFWDDRWVAIMEDVFARIARAGFDGAYLDWIEAYEDDCVAARATAEGIDPAQAMAAFVSELKSSARTINPSFLIISQNAPHLAQERPGYLSVIDALGVEDTFFGGEAGAEWGDPAGGDIPRDPEDTAELLTLYKNVYLDHGVPIFSIDYALDQANADRAYREAASAGLVPLVTQVSLSDITATPPPTY